MAERVPAIHVFVASGNFVICHGDRSSAWVYITTNRRDWKHAWKLRLFHDKNRAWHEPYDLPTQDVDTSLRRITFLNRSTGAFKEEHSSPRMTSGEAGAGNGLRTGDVSY